MASSKFSVRFFAVYLTAMAAGLLLIPERVAPRPRPGSSGSEDSETFSSRVYGQVAKALVSVTAGAGGPG